NVDQVINIVSLAEPAPDLKLLDRSLIMSELKKLDVVICFNKADLVDERESRQLMEIYQNAGYNTVLTSALYGSGLDLVCQNLAEKVSVLSGPSGAGKSTLLNALDPKLKLKTGEISRKLKRGKHTTRYVELLQVCGGFVADTPGFSNLELPPMRR